ncbi:sigma-70 family RNA polymerase sigma factor [Gordonia sp. SID5947]|uniref:RNA polymerase sigma factor ShbA n=1 Tax=Gordonia sp. SID5947 TaxID=2690315 RepID=UPI00137046D9|nr:sigma-70 family RNA polymerase sigma factor [Gordonia sp. SID5947]MYR09006.1 sigma-70 family RNA polymerase sigma factor [Gordonia sp. SID5947]
MRLAGVELDEAVRAAGQGDRVALTSVLESVKGPILRYCRGRIGVGERHLFSADHIAQEVLLAVLTALPRYQDQGRPFMAFVYGIAAHKVADAKRIAGRVRVETVVAVPEAVSATDGPDRMTSNSDTDRMLALLRTLPDKQRDVLLLRLVDGLSLEETADAVGATPGQVRAAQHRALATLKEELKKAPEQLSTVRERREL